MMRISVIRGIEVSHHSPWLRLQAKLKLDSALLGLTGLAGELSFAGPSLYLVAALPRVCVQRWW